MQEAVDEDYLHYRITSTHYVGQHLRDAGVPLLWPTGRPRDLPRRQALRLAPRADAAARACRSRSRMYELGGVRACEIGTLMFGHVDAETGEEVAGPRELVRLAIPRRTYTQSHMDYVIEVVTKVFEKRADAARRTASSSRRRSCATSRRSWSGLGSR